MKTPIRGVSKNKVQVMSMDNKPDGNRLVDHFKYLIAKGHQVEDGQIPSFVSNIGSSRKEIIKALEDYRNNFIESKKAGTMSRNVRLLGKGIVFCNLPYSMTSEEHTELIERVRSALPPEMPQVYVFHHQNRAGCKYPHLHLMLGVNGDGGKMMSKDFRDSFHEKLIDVVNNFTNELGYKRDVKKLNCNISGSMKKMIRTVAKMQAVQAGEKDAHQGMLKRLNDPDFWHGVKHGDIPGVDFDSFKFRVYGQEMYNRCLLKQYQYGAAWNNQKNAHRKQIKDDELEPLEMARQFAGQLKSVSAASVKSSIPIRANTSAPEATVKPNASIIPVSQTSELSILSILEPQTKKSRLRR